MVRGWWDIDVLWDIAIGYQSILREVLRKGLLLVRNHLWRVHQIRVSITAKMLVAWHLDMVHLLLVSLKSIQFVLVVIISNRWRGVRSWFVVFNTLVLILYLLLDPS